MEVLGLETGTMQTASYQDIGVWKEGLALAGTIKQLRNMVKSLRLRLKRLDGSPQPPVPGP